MIKFNEYDSDRLRSNLLFGHISVLSGQTGFKEFHTYWPVPHN